MADGAKHPIIEWATDHVRLFDPASNTVTEGRSISDVAGSVRGQSVVLALSRRSSFTRCTRLPDVPKPDMEKILALQLAALFPLEGSDASVDFLPLDDRNGDGRLVAVSAVRTDVLQEALSEAASAGIKVHAVWPVAVSSMLFGHSDAAIVGPTQEGLAIDLVSKGGVVASRVVPQPADSSAAMAEISRSAAAAYVQVPETVTFGKFELPGSVNTHEEPLRLLSGATFDLNIELPEKKAAKAAMQVRRSRSLAILLWAAALLMAVVVLNFRIESAQDFEKSDAKWKKRVKELNDLNAKTRSVATDLQAQQDLLASAFEPKQPLGDFVTVLTNLTPSKLWLTGVTVERGKRATLRGTALSSSAVSTYVNSLGKQSRMRDVKLVFANNALIETTPVVNFSISTHVVGNFPLPDEKGASK